MINNPIKYNKYESPDKIFLDNLPHQNITFVKSKNRRNSIYDEEEKKRQELKNMTFGKFLTDKERIKIKEEKEEITKHINPEMKFNVRTSLERVCNEINKNYYGRANKAIIDKQLKNLDKMRLNSMKVKKAPEAEKEETQSTNSSDEEEEEEDLKNNPRSSLINKAKKFKVNKRMQKLNEGAKLLLRELHNKTHFKGMNAKLINGK